MRVWIAAVRRFSVLVNLLSIFISIVVAGVIQTVKIKLSLKLPDDTALDLSHRNSGRQIADASDAFAGYAAGNDSLVE